MGRGPTAVTMERIADAVWVMRGGYPVRIMNVYFIEEPGGGTTVFDAGIETMAPHVAEVGEKLGGIKRIVLGHAHGDHRGAAPGTGAPVWCHEEERADAEGDGGHHYFDYSKLPAFARAGRFSMPVLVEKVWDGGPVRVERTVREGDEIAGFEVVHLPGHAPGLIGLWRERDRLALVSDCFYTLDAPTAELGPPRVPHPAFNLDTEQARESIRKLARLEPAAAWAGHAEPVTGDVRAQLDAAASSS